MSMECTSTADKRWGPHVSVNERKVASKSFMNFESKSSLTRQQRDAETAISGSQIAYQHCRDLSHVPPVSPTSLLSVNENVAHRFKTKKKSHPNRERVFSSWQRANVPQPFRQYSCRAPRLSTRHRRPACRPCFLSTLSLSLRSLFQTAHRLRLRGRGARKHVERIDFFCLKPV
jgi:hypothetical protein